MALDHEGRVKGGAIKWCCPQLEGWAATPADERGLRIVRSAVDSGFYLVVRAVAVADLPRMGGSDVLVAVESWMGIRHRPWCGRELARRYGDEAAFPTESPPRDR